MLLDLIAEYYKYLWLAFGPLALLKIIFSYSFHGSLSGPNNIVVSIFKWYSSDEIQSEDEDGRRTMMKVLNWITRFLLFVLVIILSSGLLLLVLGK